MSVNGLIEQKNLIHKAVLLSVLDSHYSQVSKANTLEHRLAAESKILSLYEQVIAGAFEVNTVSEFDALTENDLSLFYDTFELLQRSNKQLLQEASLLYLKRFNSFQLLFTDLVGTVKSIKQKLSVLGLKSNESRAYLGEGFNSLEKLKNNFGSFELMAVNIDEGKATLPVAATERVYPRAVSIASTSNGRPGNSNDEITQTQDPQVLLSTNSNVFEYEKLNEGPLDLTLVFELTRPEIINQLVIYPEDTAATVEFEVVDVVFTTSGKQFISIKSLTSEDTDFSAGPASLQSGLQITHLPVEAASVAIHLRQSVGETVLINGAAREQYLIALKSVVLNRIKYNSSGSVNSVEQALSKSNLYSSVAAVTVSPPAGKYFDYDLEFSVDSGASWKLAANATSLPIGLLDGGKNFIWRLSVVRDDSSFSSYSTFLAGAANSTVKTLLKSLNRNSSPAFVTLPSTPVDAVKAIQTRIGARGKTRPPVRIGTSTNQGGNYKLPFNLLKAKVKLSELRVFVGNVEYQRVAVGLNISGYEWTYSSDYQEIILPVGVDSGLPVGILFEAEVPHVEELTDSYLVTTKYLFDPDKDNIEIQYYNKPEKQSTFLTSEETVVPLGVENILPTSFVLSSTAGNVYNELDNREDLYDGDQFDYYVDYVNGIVYLNTAISGDTVWATYEHRASVQVSKGDYSISFADSLPVGILLNKNSIIVSSVSEKVSAGLKTVFNPANGNYEQRTSFVSSPKKKQLSYPNVIAGSLTVPVGLFTNGLLPVEVPYVNGFTEFLNLTYINEERVPAIQANASGVVVFSLSGRALYYQDLGIVFSDPSTFQTSVSTASAVSAIGQYNVSSTGVVVVKTTPNAVLESSFVSYYVKNAQADAGNKYSVDYARGVLHGETPLSSAAVIAYKITDLTIGYDIAKELPSVYANGVLEVRTESLSDVNTLVKVFWEEDLVSEQPSSIGDYFTPVFGTIGFRFN